jgi:hypothetical protein
MRISLLEVQKIRRLRPPPTVTVNRLIVIGDYTQISVFPNQLFDNRMLDHGSILALILKDVVKAILNLPKNFPIVF